MKLLLDECVTRLVRPDFREHAVFTVDDAGYKGLKNGALLRAASGKFDVLVTVDRKLAREQDIGKFKMALLVLVARSNRYEDLKTLIPLALEALETIKSGEVVEIKPGQ